MRKDLIPRAFITSVLLSLLFVVLYGFTNWFTAQRPPAEVGTWFFPWELTLVPYVPLLFIPYMSIDFFFFGATFLCGDRREMTVFTRRVVFLILVASAFFLLFPLKLAWPARPPVGGWFGNLVEASATAPYLMEFPHNLFPSLHIALRTLLAAIYARHTRGFTRVLSHVWFSLIGLSTMLTWQHHLVDIAGGFMVAGFAFYFFRETGSRLPVVPNPRVGAYYAIGAVAILVLGALLMPWGVFLLWPAASFAIMAAAYFGLGPGIFRKEDGTLPLSTLFVHAPVLLGQHLSLRYYRRHCRAWDEAAPNVLIGCRPTEAEAVAAVDHGVTATLDLTAEFSETASFRATSYRNLPVLDLTAPTQEQLHEATAFITLEATRGTVYVHCKIGYSRSAAVVGAYLLATNQTTTVDEVVDRLREVRPSIVIRPEALEALRRFAQRP